MTHMMGLLSLRGLNRFLMENQRYGAAREHQHATMYQDMTKPLAHYFISKVHSNSICVSVRCHRFRVWERS